MNSCKNQSFLWPGLPDRYKHEKGLIKAQLAINQPYTKYGSLE